MVGSAPLLAVAVLGVVGEALSRFLDDLVAALPKLIAGIVFLALAAVLVKVVMAVVHAVLRRILPGESPVYRQFLATIVLVFLVFGVVLSFLSIVGLSAIAASLGTATGFLALGVAYALSDMIEDVVAGVYLLRDPDFMQGDRVVVGDAEGVVDSIELRKTRLLVEGDTVVRANATIEKQWTKRGEPSDDVSAGAAE